MSNCVYPSCMMGGGGCERESKCIEEDKERKIATNRLTKEECVQIFKQFEGWNSGQKSASLCINGIRTPEDDILDAKREIYLTVLKRLKELAI